MCSPVSEGLYVQSFGPPSQTRPICILSVQCRPSLMYWTSLCHGERERAICDIGLHVLEGKAICDVFKGKTVLVL